MQHELLRGKENGDGVLVDSENDEKSVLDPGINTFIYNHSELQKFGLTLTL